MSLFNLLSLRDDEIDIATAVVTQFCSKYRVATTSENGHAALNEIVRLLLTGEKSPPVLLEAVSRKLGRARTVTSRHARNALVAEFPF